MLQIYDNIADHIWNLKYKYSGDTSIEDTFKRVADDVGDNEKEKIEFYNVMSNRLFCPGGRILSTMGTKRKNSTNFNCYLMPGPNDNIGSIMDSLKECARTLRTGGGIGLNFDNLRPNGAEVKGVESTASGPVSFMQMWDAMCKTIASAGNRRGAQLFTMNYQHPDIFEFINCKTKEGNISQANISVNITKELIDLAKKDKNIYLYHWKESAHVHSHMKPIDIPKFDNHYGSPYFYIKQEQISRSPSNPVMFNWNGNSYETVIYKIVKAKDIIDSFIDGMYVNGEPGIILIDRVNETNPMKQVEHCFSFNPCGEILSGPYGACLLGSINLVKHFDFEKKCVNFELLEQTVRTSVRFLSNVSHKSKMPLKEQEDTNKRRRKMGLGTTGLADLLICANLRYGSKESINFIKKIYNYIKEVALDENCELVKKYGKFQIFEDSNIINSSFIKSINSKLYDKIKQNGLSFSSILTCPPCGTISNLLGNVSSGIEPIFNKQYYRKIKVDKNYNNKITLNNGEMWLCTDQEIVDNFKNEIKLLEKIKLIKMDDGNFAYQTQVKDWLLGNYPEYEKSEYLVTTNDLTVKEHIDVVSAIQSVIDLSISKTINAPNNYPKQDLLSVFMDIYNTNVKCFTFYRENSRIGVITNEDATKKIEKNRPKSLKCDIHHLSISKRLDKPRTFKYMVLVGLDNQNQPHEIFAIENGHIDQSYKNGEIVKVASGKYSLMSGQEIIVKDLTKDTSNEEDCITRLISTSLQSKVPIVKIIEQLNKSEGDLMSFSKAIARALKNYIKDNDLSGIRCPQCGSSEVKYISGCPTCTCGWSKCG